MTDITETICSPTGFPTYADMHELFESFYEVPGKVILPPQFTLSDPVWPDTNAPDMQLEQTISEFINGQLTGVLASFTEVATKYLGIDPSSILPDIPGFPGYNLISIVEGEFDEMVAVAAQNLRDDVQYYKSLVPLMPTPTYPMMNTPTWDAVATTQTAITSNFQTVTQVIQTLVNLIARIADISTMGPPPTYPTLDQIYSLLPPNPTLYDLTRITIPGFGFQLSMPVPLMPRTNIPSYDFTQGLKNMYSGLSNITMSTIDEWVRSHFQLQFPVPVYCIPVYVRPPELPIP